MLRFFGLDQKTPEITIYLSRLRIKPGGTEGYVKLPRGYVGPAITAVEYQVAVLLRDLLHGGIILIPRPFQELLGNKFFALKRIDPKIVMSPIMSTENEINDEKTPEARIILGSEAYNSMAKHYLTKFDKCDFKLVEIPRDVGEGEEERVFRFRKTGGTVPGRSDGKEVAVLQRFLDKQGRHVIICAGLGSVATSGCARYLATHWRTLQRSVKNDDFTRWLIFPAGLENADGMEGMPELTHTIYDETEVADWVRPPK
jgi:hypothetical protein